MQRLTLPLAEIVVEDRQRQDYGDIDDLAESLSKFGLIQPIVINHDRRLIAGGRRFAAATKLGWATIDVVYKETLSEADLYEMELEENVRRKDLSWQERCINILTIHGFKVRKNVLEGSSWGQKETGELLNMSVGHVNNCLMLGRELRSDKNSPLWKADSIMDGLRIVLQRDEDRALAILAQKAKQTINKDVPNAQITQITREEARQAVAVNTDTGLLEEERKRYYSNPLNAPDSFETYWQDRLRRADELERTIYLSTRLHCGDCLSYMGDNVGTFDHILTDPPYAIDMEMLDQDNLGMSDIDTVEDEHDVGENLDLLASFIPRAYAAMKDAGFLVMWCDIMQWDFLYKNAIAAGFKVQRWPIVWVKTHTCMNSAAMYNTTKTTEFAIVCRKGNAVLAKPATASHIVAGHDDYKETLGHPFVKPFALWSYLIDHFTQEGQTILEPFAGRGSGVISLARKQRNFYACESNVAHYNALLENTKQYYLTLNPRFIFK